MAIERSQSCTRRPSNDMVRGDVRRASCEGVAKSTRVQGRVSRDSSRGPGQNDQLSPITVYLPICHRLSHRYTRSTRVISGRVRIVRPHANTEAGIGQPIKLHRTNLCPPSSRSRPLPTAMASSSSLPPRPKPWETSNGASSSTGATTAQPGPSVFDTAVATNSSTAPKLPERPAGLDGTLTSNANAGGSHGHRTR